MEASPPTAGTPKALRDARYVAAVLGLISLFFVWDGLTGPVRSPYTYLYLAKDIIGGIGWLVCAFALNARLLWARWLGLFLVAAGVASLALTVARGASIGTVWASSAIAFAGYAWIAYLFFRPELVTALNDR